MVDKDEALPVEHGFVGSTAITAAESGKGLIKGAGDGLWRGALIGGLLTGLLWGGLAFGVMSLIALVPFLTWLAPAAPVVGIVVGGVTAISGATVGGLIGTPAGAAVGTVHGFGAGMDRLGRDQAAVQVARSQEKTAEAQTETAKALQAKVMERMMGAQQVVTAPTAEHCGQGLKTALQPDAGKYAQCVQQQQLAAAVTELQAG